MLRSFFTDNLYDCDIIIITIIFILNFDFQVPYKTNIILHEISFFSGNTIFDVFSIKQYILFISALYSFFLNGYIDISYLTFSRLLMIIDKLSIFW